MSETVNKVVTGDKAKLHEAYKPVVMHYPKRIRVLTSNALHWRLATGAL